MRKRIWAILLCLALAAGMLPTAALAGSVFPDVADDADYAWAAKLTNEMGIFTGDENGNFNPGQGITRAQCAAVVCRLLGAEADAKGMTTDAFTDVPSSHWASSYIAWAYDRGIINGYGNGKFGPSDTVTYEQAVKMLMCAIGYGDLAVKAGGYPNGYISVAGEHGFLEGVENTFGRPAARAGIAVLAANVIRKDAAAGGISGGGMTAAGTASGMASALPSPDLSSNPSGKMAHNIYVDPDLSGTGGRFNGFLIDFRADDAGMGTYWALCNWEMDLSCLSGRSASGGGAYAGLQMRDDGSKSILSFWDIEWTDSNGRRQTTSAERVYPGSQGTNRFGGEGEGANYIADYPWQSGAWYRMYLNCYEDAATGHTFVEQWLRALPNGQWERISCFDTRLSGSCFTGSMSQFMENYDENRAEELRSFEYRNIYVRSVGSSQWTSVTSARVSVDTWYNNKKGTFAFGADGTGFWGITRGYGADTAKPNADISKSYSVSPSAKPDVPSAAQQPGSTASDKKPTITVSGEVSPSGTLTLGKNFGLRGTISTDCGKITAVDGYILNATGAAVSGQHGYYTPNASSVDIRTTINNDLVFENLPAGSYTYYVVITAKNGSSSGELTISRPFTVEATAAASDKKPTITVSGEVSPSGTLTLGKNFGLRGTISTDCGKITLCRGYILEVVDGDTAIRQRCEYTPNAASVDIRTTINNNLIFENLPAGSYKYYVLVVAENGSESTTYHFSRPFDIA